MVPNNSVCPFLCTQLRGLERALDQLDAALEADGGSTRSTADPDGGAPVATPRDVRRSLMHERRAAAWRHLNVVERDVLIVVTALCKVPSWRFSVPVHSVKNEMVSTRHLLAAQDSGQLHRSHLLTRDRMSVGSWHICWQLAELWSWPSGSHKRQLPLQQTCHGCPPAKVSCVQMAARETGFGAVEAYMHQGKLLALDLVVKLLENPLQVHTCLVVHNASTG